MLITDDELVSVEIGCGRIKKIEFPNVILETAEGEKIEIETTRNQQTDSIFWQSLLDILREEIWIPYQNKRNQLRELDWLVGETSLC